LTYVSDSIKVEGGIGGFRCISYDGRNLQHKMQPVVFCVWAKQPVESRLAPP